MGRQIIFKAKTIKAGSWVEGNLLHRVTDTCIAVKDMDDIVYYPVDPSTVCQYTGLKDYSGKTIGNIIQQMEARVKEVTVLQAAS